MANSWLKYVEVSFCSFWCRQVLNTMELAGSASLGGQGEGEQCKDRIAKGPSGMAAMDPKCWGSCWEQQKNIEKLVNLYGAMEENADGAADEETHAMCQGDACGAKVSLEGQLMLWPWQ